MALFNPFRSFLTRRRARSWPWFSTFTGTATWLWFQTLDGGASWPWFTTLTATAGWQWFTTLTPVWFATLALPDDCRPCDYCNAQRPAADFSTSDSVRRHRSRGGSYRDHPVLARSVAMRTGGGLLYPGDETYVEHEKLNLCNVCYTLRYCPCCGQHYDANLPPAVKPAPCPTCKPYSPAYSNRALMLARKLTTTPTVPPTTAAAIGADEHGAPVTLDRATRNKHLYLIGKSGTGKTTLMLNLIRGDLAAGDGLTFIDPAGDAALDVLGYVPSSRTADVVFFDPSRDDCPALNLLALPYDRDKLAGEIVSAFALFFNITPATAPRMMALLRNGLLALLDDRDHEPHSLADLERLYIDAPYRNTIAERAGDPRLRRFLDDDLPRFKRGDLDPVLNKLDAFLSTRRLARLFGSTSNALDFDAILNRRKIFVCALSKGKIGEEAAKFIGGLIVAALTVAALARADQPAATRADHFLYVDEFQNFAVESFATIFAEARKYRLNLCVAHQTRDQLTPEIRAAIGNASTYVVFRVSAPDASTLSSELSRRAYVHKLTGELYNPLSTAAADAAAVLAGTLHGADGCYYYRDEPTARAANRLLVADNLLAIGQHTQPPSGDAYTLATWPTSHAITNLKNLHAFARIERPENTKTIAVPFPPPPDPAAAAAVLEHQRHELEKTAVAEAQEKKRPPTIAQERRSPTGTTQEPNRNTTTLPDAPPDTSPDDTDDFLT